MQCELLANSGSAANGINAGNGITVASIPSRLPKQSLTQSRPLATNPPHPTQTTASGLSQCLGCAQHIHTYRQTDTRYRQPAASKLSQPEVKPFKAQWLIYVPYSGHYMYHQSDIQQCYVLPTQCICVFCVDLRTNSDYFPMQHCAVRTGSLYIILRSVHTVCLCVLCGSENKQRLFPYTALTDWFL